MGFAPGFVNYKKVIKFTSCLLMVGGFLRILRLLPKLKLVRHDIAEILLKVALKHQKSNQIILLIIIQMIKKQIFIFGHYSNCETWYKEM
jgi:hypothetical protein